MRAGTAISRAADATMAGMYHRLNRAMKRSVGARVASASSTRRMMRAIVLSSWALVTRTLRAASVLIDPAKTGSPGPFVLGTLSPVTGLSSMPEDPSTISPSEGMRSPGRTRTSWPTSRFAAGTSRGTPSSSSLAVLGTRSASARMPCRALPAATPSSSSPTANRKTTTAASSAAPMNSAPVPAIVIRLSIVKGRPSRSAAKAVLATGASPIRLAPTKGHLPAPGVKCSTAHETQMSSAMEMASRPFPVWCQFVSNSSLSWHPQLPVFFVPAEEFLQPPSSTLFLLGGVRGSI